MNKKPKPTKQNDQMTDQLMIDMPLPSAPDVEEVVLGAMMVDPEGLSIALPLLNDDSFYSTKHKSVFSAITSLYRQNSKIDIVTVSECIRANGNLDNAGGAIGIAHLINRPSSAANIEDHCLILKEFQIRRELINTGIRAQSKGHDLSADVFDSMKWLDQNLENIQGIATSGGNMLPMISIMEKVRATAILRQERARMNKSMGITSGLSKLDTLTGGWQNSNLIILAARPGMGKTAMMLRFALAAAEQKIPVCIYSLEMSNISLANRLTLAISNIDSFRFKNGQMNSDDWDLFALAQERLSKLPIYVDDQSQVSLKHIKGHTSLMKRKGQCGLILIDYLQLADIRTNEYNRNREQEVAQASRQAKIIAKTLDVPVILLSQLSRDVEKRGGQYRPVLSDLRDSGAIEQDADLVLFLYRPGYYFTKDQEGNNLTGIGEIIIAKHRDGQLGTVKFKHNESLTKIFDYDE